MKGRRNILKIMTLGVGLAVGLMLASKVCFEKTFDDFYKDADRIYYLNEAIELNGRYQVYPQVAEIGRASVGKECVRRCRSRWSPYH